MGLIPLWKYAEKFGLPISSTRRKAEAGGFLTAEKIGRNWVIDEDEPFDDKRVISGRYQRRPKRCSKKWDLTTLAENERDELIDSIRAGRYGDASNVAFHAFKRVLVDEEDGFGEWIAAMALQCRWEREHPDDLPIAPIEKCIRQHRLDHELDDNTMACLNRLLEVKMGDSDEFVQGVWGLLSAIDAKFKPDFEALADDMKRWHMEKKPAQIRWMRTIHAAKDPMGSKEGDAR